MDTYKPICRKKISEKSKKMTKICKKIHNYIVKESKVRLKIYIGKLLYATAK